MKQFAKQSLSYDPVHGYIPFTSDTGEKDSSQFSQLTLFEELPDDLPEEITERDLIDQPWLQRLRRIHQLQTAWWVFPTAEHTRFQHVLGAMHLASRVARRLYPSLQQVCDDVPSRGYVESLLRITALLHDVGHGPFGHFFDEHFLSQYDLNHEILGGVIVRERFASLLSRVRRNPNSELEAGEVLNADQVIYLMTRPGELATKAGFRLNNENAPRWLQMLQSLFCGLYTVDNLDFVLRDSYMSGYEHLSFDLERLLNYSAFTEKGLTIHERGLGGLVRFISVRAELFRTIYFHRTVRAIDLDLQDLFRDSKDLIFPQGNPAENLDDYLRFTEWSLFCDTESWAFSDDPHVRELGKRWQQLASRELSWRMAVEKSPFFDAGQSEKSSIFSKNKFLTEAVRDELPPELADLEFRVDIARLMQRPADHTPTEVRNFLCEQSTGKIVPLTDQEIFRFIPPSQRICRIFTKCEKHDAILGEIMDRLTGTKSQDDPTNM